MERDKVLEKLRKIKELAERGVGGERDTALQMYNKLIEKYSIADSEILAEKLTKYWFSYKDELSRKLIIQIFYKVTGSTTYWVKTDKRHKQVGIECTELELDEIKFYYNFYIVHLREELDIFMRAFMNVNELFPDSSARCYEESDDNNELTEKEIERLSKIFNMAKGMEKKKPGIRIDDKSTMIEDKGGK